VLIYWNPDFEISLKGYNISVEAVCGYCNHGYGRCRISIWI
jgi:hypothetical protein